MAFLNTKRSAIFISNTSTLPTPPSGFLETTEPFIVNPQLDVQTFKRISSKLGNTDSYIDTNKNMVSQSITHNMRTSDIGATALDTPPEWGKLLVLAGFDEVINTTTPGQETVIYKNSQTPTRGSGIFYMDGKKFTATNCLVADLTITGQAGQIATMTSNIQGYLDNAGVPTNEVPTIPTLSTESVVGLTVVDIITAGGDVLTCDQFTLTTNPTITNIYATGTKQHDITDYDMTLELSYFVDSAKYADAINDLNAQTVEAVVIKLNTTAGALVSGKSIEITCPVAKARQFSDSNDQDKIKRTFTYGLQLNGSDTAVQIKLGYFA